MEIRVIWMLKAILWLILVLTRHPKNKFSLSAYFSNYPSSEDPARFLRNTRISQLMTGIEKFFEWNL